MKNKETLEEAAEKLYSEDIMWGMDLNKDTKNAFIQGAKWMAKRMYSNEEMKDMLDKTIEKFYKHTYSDKTKSEMKELWFEQFKK
jgi:hypothetical protein